MMEVTGASPGQREEAQQTFLEIAKAILQQMDR
jgi:hypothetical protein